MTQDLETALRTRDGTTLSIEQAGEGAPIVLLHGLTATRRYVVMGSRLLERSGHRVIGYDARGHGRSGPAPAPDAYGYGQLASDLEAVMDALSIERATLAGASMGAHTIVRFALEKPERVAAIALMTPAFDPDLRPGAASDAPVVRGGGDAPGSTGARGPAGVDGAVGSDAGGAGGGGEPAFAGWDALARGLREGGVEGFIAAYDLSALPERWRATVLTVVRQRLAAHRHPEAVADALEAVPRSRPFPSIAELARIDVPTLVVASRDEPDPGHPLAVAERYARAIPGAGLLVEEPGAAPIAWQGGKLSRALVELVEAAR